MKKFVSLQVAMFAILILWLVAYINMRGGIQVMDAEPAYSSARLCDGVVVAASAFVWVCASMFTIVARHL